MMTSMGDHNSNRRKSRLRLLRRVLTHGALLVGAAVFIVPFLWLLSTSISDQDQIAKYPPDLIPSRRETVVIDGRIRKMSILSKDDEKLSVAELGDAPNGKKLVQVISQGEGREMMEVSPALLTEARRFSPRWANYKEALDMLPKETHKGLLYLWNTVYMTTLSIIGVALSSSLAAYSFARLRWPGRDALFLVVLATMMIPGAVTMVPVFLIFRALGWIDTLRPFWIPSFLGGAFGIFLLRQFFLTIPGELEDAAKIDGCSYFGIYWSIMLPLIKPALAALTIFTFMGSWNNFMGPLIYISSPEKMPMAYALQLFSQSHGSEYGPLMAALTLMMLPVLLIFFFTQRYFIQGVTLTGIKG